MRTPRFSKMMLTTAWLAAFSTTGLQLMDAPARAQQLAEWKRNNTPAPHSELKPGTTQSLTPAQWKQVDAARAASHPRLPVRTLSVHEMRVLRGQGQYRQKYFAGTLPWHRSLRDANLCNGNLFKSFTDMQVAPAKGAGLALQRTYNSNDDRVGPFGVGWTHAYDIRMEEENPTTNQTDTSLNVADRTDFFGAKHKYHRDADGLYSPPAYFYDELSSDYANFLVSGPIKPLADTEHSMDGTVKHFIADDTSRVCDSITDRYGNVTTLTYTTVVINSLNKKLVNTVTDPSGRQLVFTWTNLGTVSAPAYRVTQVSGPQYSVTYGYDSSFNLQTVTLDPTCLNRTTTFGYTSYSGTNGTETGLLASISDPLSHVMSYSYGLASGTGSLWVTGITEPAGVDPTTGNPRTYSWTIIPPTSVATAFDVEWLSGSDTNADNDDLMMHINVDTQFRKVGFWNATSHSYEFFNTAYDTANNITSQDAPLFYAGATPIRKDNYTYGPHGNVLTHTASGFTGTETTTYYNASQYFQKQSFTDMNGHTTTCGVGTNTDTNVGNRGSVLWMQDARYATTGVQFTYTYNSNGQKTSETNLNSVVTNYTYGGSGDAIVNGHAVGNLTQIVQDSGTGHLNRTTSMQYDVAGHVRQSTDPNGKISLFYYNVLGQPTEADFPATTSTAAETVQYAYDTNGRTHSVSDNRGLTTLTYENGCDRVSSVSDPVTGSVGYTYSPTGQRLTIGLPGGGTWNYTYSQGTGTWAQYILEVMPKDDPNSLSPALRSLTDDQGRRVDYSDDLPGGSFNGSEISGRPRYERFNQTFTTGGSPTLLSYCETDYTYDSDGGSYSRFRLSRLSNTWNYKDGMGTWHYNVRLVQNDYTSDNAGNRLTNQITNPDSTYRTEQYGYDELNRLTSVNYNDTPAQSQTYSFDNMGNRLTKNDTLTGNESYTYNNANMLLTRGSNNYTNDSNGNTLTGGGRTNTWDSQNRLVQCVYNSNTSTFKYGADGIRRQETVNGATTDFVLDASTFIRELRGGTSYATYLVGPRGPEYRRDNGSPSTAVVRWYLYDGLGSVLGEVDPNGTITAKRKYDVFGVVRSGDAGTSKHKFVGTLSHPSEDETTFIYMQARYMDPQTGRFVNEDPGRHTTNWFIYANDNPTTYYDRNGKDFTLGGVLSTIGDYLSVTAENSSGQIYLLNQLCQDIGALSETGQLTVEEVQQLKAIASFLDAVSQKGLATVIKETGMRLTPKVAAEMYQVVLKLIDTASDAESASIFYGGAW